MPDKNNAENNYRKAYTTLRERIALLKYQPGESLNEAELAEELGFSRSPIRKALVILQEENLVNKVPRKGTYVSSVTLRELKEVFSLRNHLLKLVAKQLADNITAEEIDSLKSLNDKMKEENDEEKLIKMDLNFHCQLHRATHNQLLAQYMRTLLFKASRIWNFSVNEKLAHEFSADFSDLIDAIERRDKNEIERVQISHSQKTIKYIQDDLNEI